MKIKCSICGKITRAKIPKGGDGPVFWPYLHEIYDKVCPGSWQEEQKIL